MSTCQLKKKKQKIKNSTQSRNNHSTADIQRDGKINRWDYLQQNNFIQVESSCACFKIKMFTFSLGNLHEKREMSEMKLSFLSFFLLNLK